MSLLWRKLFCLPGVVLCSLSLRAQPMTHATAPVPLKSPVAVFREMLTMSPEDRRATISIYPPESQKRILEKLDEYRMLPDELREKQLRETELRWYLRPLMDEARTNRAARLALIPEEERSLVEERLQLWDLLPPDLKQQWTNDDMVADYFAQIQLDPDHRDEILSTVPPERRKELEQGLDHWKEMTGGERQKALLSFNRFFELTPEEEEKTLDTLSDQEREQMKKTLDAYKNLSPQQRRQCILSFEKFANMSVAERNEFLKNAERWNEMTPAERQKWRDLVTVAPIMPPTPDTAPPKLRSHSQRLTPLTVPPAVATN